MISNFWPDFFFLAMASDLKMGVSYSDRSSNDNNNDDDAATRVQNAQAFDYWEGEEILTLAATGDVTSRNGFKSQLRG